MAQLVTSWHREHLPVAWGRPVDELGRTVGQFLAGDIHDGADRLRFLLENGAAAEAVCAMEYGYLPIQLAAITPGAEAAVRVLLDWGERPNVEGETADERDRRRRLCAVNALSPYRVNTTAATVTGGVTAGEGTEQRRAGEVLLPLEDKTYGRTPLLLLCGIGVHGGSVVGMIELLCARGADVTALDAGGRSALQLAIMNQLQGRHVGGGGLLGGGTRRGARHALWRPGEQRGGALPRGGQQPPGGARGARGPGRGGARRVRTLK